MTIEYIMQPFTVVINWLRNTTFYLGQYPFTLWDFVVWSMIASVVVWFLGKILN